MSKRKRGRTAKAQASSKVRPQAARSGEHNRRAIHKTLRTTPAMAARVTERLWEIGDIVNVLRGMGGCQVRRGLHPVWMTPA